MLRSTRSLLAPTSRALSIMESGIAPRPAVIINAAKGMLNHMFMVTSPLAWYIIPGLKSPPKS